MTNSYVGYCRVGTSMAKSQSSPGSSEGALEDPEDHELNRDVVLDVLSNERRRYVIHELKQQNGKPVSDGDLAERIAGWELEKPVDELNYKERKRVKNALRQFHLPKMEEAGFVEYDQRAGTVTLSYAAAEQDFYVDVLPKRGIPWGLYYLAFSAVSAVVLAGAVLSVPPFSALSSLNWCVFFAVALAVSSVAHFYDNYYRMRLGAREEPPDLE
jgi:hypothetical protein